jgi:6-pyruvoyl-tetrahydropterin synthase
MSRWVIHSRTTFNARHALTSYRGAPEEPHEHQWKVAIQVGTDELCGDGYALDFHDVHTLVDRVVAPLKDSDLNRHREIGTPTPSAERLAEVLAEQLQPGLAAIGGRLLVVSVWEGPENRVDLRLDER